MAPLQPALEALAPVEPEPSQPSIDGFPPPAEPASLRAASLVGLPPVESAVSVSAGPVLDATLRLQQASEDTDKSDSDSDNDAPSDEGSSAVKSVATAGTLPEGLAFTESAPLPVPEAAVLAVPEPLSQLSPEHLDSRATDVRPNVNVVPNEDALLRFQKLTHDQLSLRVEDVDGTMDVELSREQSALQVKIVAPVDVVPELLGLSSAVENALASIGLQLDSYTAFAHQDEPEISEKEGDDSEDAEGSDADHDQNESTPDRLLDLIV
jgi:hypothetical protein